MGGRVSEGSEEALVSNRQELEPTSNPSTVEDTLALLTNWFDQVLNTCGPDFVDRVMDEYEVLRQSIAAEPELTPEPRRRTPDDAPDYAEMFQVDEGDPEFSAVQMCEAWADGWNACLADQDGDR